MDKEIIITLPKLGESIVNATVLQWHKKPGETVLKDEPLLEVNTDKVASEIPSPVSGTLVKIHAESGALVDVGNPLATISTSKHHHAHHHEPVVNIAKSPQPSSDHSFLTPAVLRLMHEKKIPLGDIDKISHTGHGGRLTKQDVENYCPLMSQQIFSGDIERVKMSPLRKAIADNMVKSFYGAPHASLVTEMDVTELVAFIAKEKQVYFEKHGVKLSVTAFFARAMTQALQVYPLLNASVESDTIIVKKFINLGIAVSVDQGVMVPVIRNCQNLGLEAISKEISSLAEKSRKGTLVNSDVQEGSITLTNFGVTGIEIGIPIIRYPEVAIVAIGSSKKKVCAMPDDTMAIRSIMMVSLTFDHRVIDGLYGCGFLAELKKTIEQAIHL